AAVDNRVIRVPGKRTRWIGALHPDVERIVHKQVHQNRTDHPALWRATLPWHLSAFCRLERCSKPPLDVQQDPVFLDVAANRFYQQDMINLIERPLDVKL